MLNPGYYAVHRDVLLDLGSKRTWLRKRDWLVTDGLNIGVFDKEVALDWLPLQWTNGQPLILTDELKEQVQAAVAPASFPQLERRLRQQLDTEDGAPIPDMPRPSINALGPYLRSQRTLLAYTYQR